MNLEIKRAKAQADQMDASMQIGKNGITEGVLAEAKKRLEKTQLVKIRVLKNSEQEPKAIAEELAKALLAQVLSQKGQTISLYKKMKK